MFWGLDHSHLVGDYLWRFGTQSPKPPLVLAPALVKTSREDAEMMCWRRPFQLRAAAAGNVRASTVERRVWWTIQRWWRGWS